MENRSCITYLTPKIARLLSSLGRDVNVKDSHCTTPLVKASVSLDPGNAASRLELVRMYIEAGAEVSDPYTVL